MRRPYGVGLLVAGYDATTGAHLYRTCPSGNFYEYSAYAIGARSQAGRTYLEKKFETFPDGGCGVGAQLTRLLGRADECHLPCSQHLWTH